MNNCLPVCTRTESGLLIWMPPNRHLILMFTFSCVRDELRRVEQRHIETTADSQRGARHAARRSTSGSVVAASIRIDDFRLVASALVEPRQQRLIGRDANTHRQCVDEQSDHVLDAFEYPVDGLRRLLPKTTSCWLQYLLQDQRPGAFSSVLRVSRCLRVKAFSAVVVSSETNTRFLS